MIMINYWDKKLKKKIACPGSWYNNKLLLYQHRCIFYRTCSKWPPLRCLSNITLSYWVASILRHPVCRTVTSFSISCHVETLFLREKKSSTEEPFKWIISIQFYVWIFIQNLSRKIIMYFFQYGVEIYNFFETFIKSKNRAQQKKVLIMNTIKSTNNSQKLSKIQLIKLRWKHQFTLDHRS